MLLQPYLWCASHGVKSNSPCEDLPLKGDRVELHGLQNHKAIGDTYCDLLYCLKYAALGRGARLIDEWELLRPQTLWIPVFNLKCGSFKMQNPTTFKVLRPVVQKCGCCGFCTIISLLRDTLPSVSRTTGSAAPSKSGTPLGNNQRLFLEDFWRHLPSASDGRYPWTAARR